MSVTECILISESDNLHNYPWKTHDDSLYPICIYVSDNFKVGLAKKADHKNNSVFAYS